MKSASSTNLAEKEAKRHELRGEGFSPSPRPDEQLTRRVIAISRTYGSGGVTVAGMVAAQLGWPLWDREILDLMARQSEGRMKTEVLESLDERRGGVVANFLSSLVGNTDDLTYTYLLPRAIHHIARQDAVILGRGAYLLVPGALRILLEAPWQSRVERIMEMHNLTAAEARKLIERRDRERGEFLQEVRRKFGSHPPGGAEEPEYDLVVNTAHLGHAIAAELILLAARAHFQKIEQRA